MCWNIYSGIINLSQAFRASEGHTFMGCVEDQDLAPELGRNYCVRAESQIILMTNPITEEHKHVCPQLEPQYSVRTSPGFITRESRPEQIPEILPSCQPSRQPNIYVSSSLCARVFCCQGYKQVEKKLIFRGLILTIWWNGGHKRFYLRGRGGLGPPCEEET